MKDWIIRKYFKKDIERIITSIMTDAGFIGKCLNGSSTPPLCILCDLEKQIETLKALCPITHAYSCPNKP